MFGFCAGGNPFVEMNTVINKMELMSKLMSVTRGLKASYIKNQNDKKKKNINSDHSPCRP